MSDTDTMLPVIRQMHEADGDAHRARILLNLPHAILLKYEPVFAAACRRAQFDLGEAWVTLQVDALRAVRDDAGNLPANKALPLRDLRAALIAMQACIGEGR